MVSFTTSLHFLFYHEILFQVSLGCFILAFILSGFFVFFVDDSTFKNFATLRRLLFCYTVSSIFPGIITSIVIIYRCIIFLLGCW